MSCFTIQVLEPSGKIIEVETHVGTNIYTTTLDNYSTPNIELTECVAQLPADFNDQIFSVVSGSLIASTGISIVSDNNKLYLNSIINGGSGINVSEISGTYTIAVTGNFGLTSEEVDDRVSSLLSAGTGIVLTYNDNIDNLVISTSGVSLFGHNHVANDITDFDSEVSGIINTTISTTLTAGTGISIEYYSGNNTLNISTSGVSFVGHKHVANEINDFNDAVKLVKLNDLSAPTGNVTLNNHRIISLATPISGTDAVNKNYIDNLWASTTIKGIASFSSGDFSVTSGVVTIKNSGIDNNQLIYNYITLGSTNLILGSSYSYLSGVIIDGGSP